MRLAGKIADKALDVAKWGINKAQEIVASSKALLTVAEGFLEGVKTTGQGLMKGAEKALGLVKKAVSIGSKWAANLVNGLTPIRLDYLKFDFDINPSLDPRVPHKAGMQLEMKGAIFGMEFNVDKYIDFTNANSIFGQLFGSAKKDAQSRLRARRGGPAENSTLPYNSVLQRTRRAGDEPRFATPPEGHGLDLECVNCVRGVAAFLTQVHDALDSVSYGLVATEEAEHQVLETELAASSPEGVEKELTETFATGATEQMEIAKQEDLAFDPTGQDTFNQDAVRYVSRAELALTCAQRV